MAYTLYWSGMRITIDHTIHWSY